MKTAEKWRYYFELSSRNWDNNPTIYEMIDDMEALEKQIEELKEYKWKYEQLAK